MLKRYGLEGIAKVLIAIGALLIFFSWLLAFYYFMHIGKIVRFLIPATFTGVMALLLLVIKYRYTLFERYPYLMNLPSFFYHAGEKGSTNKQSLAFSMIFTVHALVIAFLGALGIVLVLGIGTGVKRSGSFLFLYIYLAIIAVLLASVLLQYRKIYVKVVK